MFPAELAQGLAGASPKDLAEVQVTPSGAGLRWPSLDADFSLPNLLAGEFGSKSWMAKLSRDDSGEVNAALLSNLTQRELIRVINHLLATALAALYCRPPVALPDVIDTAMRMRTLAASVAQTDSPLTTSRVSL